MFRVKIEGIDHIWLDVEAVNEADAGARALQQARMDLPGNEHARVADVLRVWPHVGGSVKAWHAPLRGYPDGTPYPDYPKETPMPHGPWEWTQDPPQVDPPQDDRPDPSILFNVNIPSHAKQAVIDSITRVKAGEISAVAKASPWSGVDLILEDREFNVPGKAEFLAALPYMGTNHLRYVSQYFVCRSYASAFVSVAAAVLHDDAVGKVLDFKGHHSYNMAVVKGAAGCELLVVEPQEDRVVLRPDPTRHYTGSGVCVFGG